MKEAFEAVALAEQDLKIERLRRDAKFKVIHESLRLYRLAVPARLPNNEVLLAALPRLTPEPGSTPDAVNASGVFQAPNQFKVVYDASAAVIATNAKDAPREFISAFGLTQPGAKVSVSVYVITNAGNQKGSAPMTITRPV